MSLAQTTKFPIDWCRGQFPALARAGGAAGRLSRRSGRQPGARDGRRRGGSLPGGNERQSRRAFCDEHRQRRDAGRCAPGRGRFAGGPGGRVDDFWRQHDFAHVRLQPGLARTWRAGDEIIVTRLDHDANVSPWVLAARDAGVTVHKIDFRPEDCTLDVEQFKSRLSERTRLVAVGCASNAVGTINPVADICRWAHDAGSQVFLDAVHYAPHGLLDVAAWGCDYLACSAYKFFGPHVGMLWGRPRAVGNLATIQGSPGVRRAA